MSLWNGRLGTSRFTARVERSDDCATQAQSQARQDVEGHVAVQGWMIELIPDRDSCKIYAITSFIGGDPLGSEISRKQGSIHLAVALRASPGSGPCTAYLGSHSAHTGQSAGKVPIRTDNPPSLKMKKLLLPLPRILIVHRVPRKVADRRSRSNSTHRAHYKPYLRHDSVRFYHLGSLTSLSQ